MEEIDPTYEGPLFLYALAKKPNAFDAIMGVNDKSILWLDRGEIGILVSKTDLSQIRPQRAHLLAYNNAISRLMAKATVLPFTFGSIAKNRFELEKQFESGNEKIIKSIEHIDGAIEMGVRISIKGITKYAYLAENDADLKQWLHALNKNPEQISHNVRIEAGQRTEQSLNRFNQVLIDHFKSTSKDLCRDYKISPGKNDEVLLDIACLVSRSREAEFIPAIEIFSKVFQGDESFNIHITGPWAPFSFASVTP